MGMFTTIIVDDDFLVRSYLKQLRAWEKAGFEITADVRDGEEALNAVEELQPDVVVTDISMPLMDGIELIRQLRQGRQNPYIIVLSCHDDFEYVKEAMRLGANEYVLKNTLNEETLYDMLKKAAQQMEGMQKQARKEDQTQRLIKMGSQSLKFHYFNGILAGSLTGERKEEKRIEAGITGKYVNSAVISTFIPGWAGLRGEHPALELEQYSQGFLQRLIERLELLPGPESRYVEVVYLGEGVFCCFLDMSDIRRTSLMKQRLTSAASACFQCCQDETFSFAVGVSSICFGEEGIRQAYQQAREMMKLSFYEDGEILYYDGQPVSSGELPISAEQLLNQIQELAEGRRYDEMESAFEQVVKDFRGALTDAHLVIHWLKDVNQKLGVEKNPEFYGSIVSANQLLDVCREYRMLLASENRKEVPKGVSAVIRRVIDYLHLHYKEQIGLTEAAEEVSLNSAYLSYLFKQEMGIGFSNYLLDIRIESAKVLLENTNYKIKDVAAEAGFNDYHYFSKAFKKQTGHSPADYRREKSR